MNADTLKTAEQQLEFNMNTKHLGQHIYLAEKKESAAACTVHATFKQQAAESPWMILQLTFNSRTHQRNSTPCLVSQNTHRLMSHSRLAENL